MLRRKYQVSITQATSKLSGNLRLDNCKSYFSGRFPPNIRRSRSLAGKQSGPSALRRAASPSNFRPLSEHQSIFDIDTKISDRVFDLGMAQ